MYLNPTEKRKLIFPLIYQTSKQGDPFVISIHVEGEFQEIVPIVGKCLVNTDEKVVTYSIKRMDFEKKEKIEQSFFYIKPDKYKLDFPAEKIKSVEFVFEFYTLTDGKKKRYQATNIFSPKGKKYTTNDALSI